MDLCAWKDALGKPREGVHSYRLFDIAIVDLILTMIGAYAISVSFNIGYGWSLFGLLLAGIVAHRLFCVRTKVDTLLFE
jgi:hypothetical protein